MVWIVLAVTAALMVQGSWGQGADKSRAELWKAFDKGNYKDAYDGLSKLVLGDAEKGKELGEDLTRCVQALSNLGRLDETDELIEKAVAAHPKDVLLLMAAAGNYYSLQHNGHIIAGKYYRGGHRAGGGKWMNSMQRDRVRQLQLLLAALQNVGGVDKETAANVYHAMADALVNGFSGREAWRLGALMDLATLPDYEEGWGYGWWGGGKGAPVNEDGSPMYHANPKSWEAAKTDGERWRWCMTQAAEVGGVAMANRVRWEWASFLHEQLGVQTMAWGGWWGRQADDETKKDEAGPMAVSTLGEDETMARLATGIKRFKVPDEYNYIRVCQQILSGGANDLNAMYAEELLAQTWEDRQQYPKAAEEWREIIKRFPNHTNQKSWQKRLEQVVGNWGMFESTEMKPANEDAAFLFRFRNGKKVTFTASEVDVAQLLEDVKAFIRTKPNQLDWDKINIGNIGYRVMEANQKKYIGKEVAKWDLALEPREKHFDRMVGVKTPEALRKAGAYFVTATMDGPAQGNTCFMVLWVADTAIVKKPLSDGTFLFVADAGDGEAGGGCEGGSVWLQPPVGEGEHVQHGHSGGNGHDG